MTDATGTFTVLPGLRRVEGPADWDRQEAHDHFGEIPEGASICYCSTCNGFYLANPYPAECPGSCDGYGVRTNTMGYYYAHRAANPPQSEAPATCPEA